MVAGELKRSGRSGVFSIEMDIVGGIGTIMKEII